MKGCRTIAEYFIKKWMEDNGFEMSAFSVAMDGNIGAITDSTGACMKVRYSPEEKTVTEVTDGDAE